MSNIRIIAFFLFGIAVLLAILTLPRLLGEPSAVAADRKGLSLLAVNEIDGVSVGAVRLQKVSGKWRIVAPIHDDTNTGAVNKLLDALAEAEIEDYRTSAELARKVRVDTDFAFKSPSQTVTITAGEESETFVFGRRTPSQESVYVKISGIDSIFTVSAKVLEALNVSAEGLRRRSATHLVSESVVAIELRQPGMPFVKLVKRANVWTFTSPAQGPADADAVEALLRHVSLLTVNSFADGMDDSASGIAGDDSFSIKLTGSNGDSDLIAFGSKAGEESVWMRFGDYGAIGTVPAREAAFCRKTIDDFRNIKIFAIDERSIRFVRVTMPDELIALSMDDTGLWRIEAPSAREADQEAAAAFVKRIASLRRSDLAETGEKDAIGVVAATEATNMPPVAISRRVLGENPLTPLLNRTILSVKPADIRRITQRKRAGARTVVERDAMRNTWNLVRTPGDGNQGRELMPDAVRLLLETLENVEAEKIVAISADEATRKASGLDKDSFTLSVDFLDQGKPKRVNIFVGERLTGGGRYATEGVDGALAVLPDEIAYRLVAPLTQ